MGTRSLQGELPVAQQALPGMVPPWQGSCAAPARPLPCLHSVLPTPRLTAPRRAWPPLLLVSAECQEPGSAESPASHWLGLGTMA